MKSKASCCGMLATLLSITIHAGEVQQQAFYSETLSRNYPYKVYLPDAHADGAHRFPVLYLLHGAGGDENE